MELPKRKSIRLKDYDYSQNGEYFVTICIKDKLQLLWNVGATFGRPFIDNVHLSEYGLIIEGELNKINNIYTPTVVIDKYVIMPNHIHLIIILRNVTDGAVALK